MKREEIREKLRGTKFRVSSVIEFHEACERLKSFGITIANYNNYDIPSDCSYFYVNNRCEGGIGTSLVDFETSNYMELPLNDILNFEIDMLEEKQEESIDLYHNITVTDIKNHLYKFSTEELIEIVSSCIIQVKENSYNWFYNKGADYYSPEAKKFSVKMVKDFYKI